MEKADRSDPRHVLTPEGCQSVHPDDVEIAGGSRGWEHQPYGPVGLWACCVEGPSVCRGWCGERAGVLCALEESLAWMGRKGG